MNWRFWNRSEDAGDGCTAMEPLLSLYSDRMASPTEMRRVEAHLSGCPACRQALYWMQATQQVIAGRPPVPPPTDLRARIARAIAESESVKVPALTTPVRPARRPLILRPALAYGLSVAVFAAVTGSLLWNAHQPVRHQSNQTANNSVPPPPIFVSPVPPTVPALVKSGPRPTNRRSALTARGLHAGTSIPGIHHPAFRVSPPPEEVANNLVDNSVDNGGPVPAADVTLKKPLKLLVVPVRRPNPLQAKRPTGLTNMASNKSLKDHASTPPLKSPVHSVAPPDRVATNRVPLSHPDLPESTTPPQIEVKPPVITHEPKSEVHEASTTETLRSFALLMRQAPMNNNTVARNVSTVGASLNGSSDASGTVALVASALH